MDPRSKPVPAQWRGPIDDWTLALALAGRARPTITTRTDHLRRAARALGGSPWAVTPADLTRWAGPQNWTTETRRSVYASLRGFFAWAVTHGHLQSSPAAGLPVIKPSAPLPRPAPEPVYASGVRAADDRTRLILRLAAEAGLRRAEVARVHARDLVEDLAGWSLITHGKGARDRIVPLSADLALTVRAACLAGGGWAFPGGDEGHLSPQWVGKLATRVLPDGWTLHNLRHRFASRAYAGSRDLLAVQQLLGHSSPTTTQRYVAMPDDALRAAMLHAA